MEHLTQAPNIIFACNPPKVLESIICFTSSTVYPFIRAIGNWSYPLNFADLASKGKIYLDSPLVIGTTNCANVHAEWAPFITEPTALVRRFQSAMWVDVTEEYKTPEGRFNFELVSEEMNKAMVKIQTYVAEKKAAGESMSVNDVLDRLPWNIWRVRRHTFDREQIGDQEIPGGIRAVVSTAAKAIKERKVSNRKEVDDLQKLQRENQKP